MNHKKNVLTIAGSDSSGGAGIQADIKTLEALNVYSASVITSITAQNTIGVQAVYDLPEDVVEQQLISVLSDIDFDAIKIGMLKKSAYVLAISEQLQKYTTPFIIFDPVMISSSGRTLIDDDAISEIISRLFPLIDLLTPNIPEAATLLNKETSWVAENQAESSKLLLDTFSLKAVLLKGGHSIGEYCEDILAQKSFNKSIKVDRFKYKKIMTPHSHGTGCTLSSAIAAFYTRNLSVLEATKLAGQYLQQTLLSAHMQKVGKGTGPLNHHIRNY